jgi:uncharacterized protein (TIGR03067 family)
VNSFQQVEAQDSTQKGTDKEAKAKEKKTTDLDLLQGAWITTLEVIGGRPDYTNNVTLTFGKEKVSLTKEGRAIGDWGFTIDLEKKTIDFNVGGKIIPGIYKLDGDKLTLCLPERGNTRPEKFESSKKTEVVLLELQREKPKENKETKAKEKKLTDLDLLQDTWIVTSVIDAGKPQETDDVTFTFGKERVSLTKRGRADQNWGFTLDLEKKTIDFNKGGRIMPGIYQLDGDKFILCYAERGDTRPEKFEALKGTQIRLVEFKREKPIQNQEARTRPVPDNLEEAKKQIAELIAENNRLRKEIQQSQYAAQLARAAQELESTKANPFEALRLLDTARESARKTEERVIQYQEEIKKLREELEKKKNSDNSKK